MWDWIGSNASALNVGLNAAMLLIWLAYLQLFFVSFRRSNRTVIHIGMASESGEDARCLVTNMGSDTAYVLAVMVGLDDGDRTRLAPVTDRVEDEDPVGGDFRDKTNQGPLRGGEALDIGSLRNIVSRAAHQIEEDISLDDCRAVEITVVVAAQQAHRLAGGRKRYEIDCSGGRMRFRPENVLTDQIRTRRDRQALLSRMNA
ncbi:hypothetical protein JF540_05725 [Salipiger thiooxidans]|uniref:hypothetical protein n=1 Tax=Salipiger thiooxidans TaxID=282683 RepID=UPI001A8E0EEF|nr:hypothetical protein [Salipiger thiooxidans]MBN8186181.1 hypothetical protein [Salipiger thiooxidans]